MNTEDTSTTTETAAKTTDAMAPKVRKPRKAKKAAKRSARKAKPNGGIPMSALKVARKQYRVDKKTKTPKGNPSVHCGDETARKLLGKDLGAVYEMAAKVKGVSAGTLKAKYRHLNVGAQRMTLGNIIRAAA